MLPIRIPTLKKIFLFDKADFGCHHRPIFFFRIIKKKTFKENDSYNFLFMQIENNERNKRRWKVLGKISIVFYYVVVVMIICAVCSLFKKWGRKGGQNVFLTTLNRKRVKVGCKKRVKEKEKKKKPLHVSAQPEVVVQ